MTCNLFKLPGKGSEIASGPYWYVGGCTQHTTWAQAQAQVQAQAQTQAQAWEGHGPRTPGQHSDAPCRLPSYRAHSLQSLDRKEPLRGLNVPAGHSMQEAAAS